MRQTSALGAAAVAGGVVLSLAYPPLDWAGGAWIALVPLLVMALWCRPRAALGWGWLSGTVFFLLLLRWLNFTFRVYSTIPWPLSWGPTVLLSSYCGLWIGAVCAAVAVLAARRRPAWALAAAPFLWIAAEWGRGHLFGGFPWGTLGYSQYRQLAIIQIAELGSVTAVSFVVALVNAALAGAIALSRRTALTGIVIAAVAVAATLGFGVRRLGHAEPAGQVTVVAMQPAIEQPLKWDDRYTETTLRIYGDLTRAAARLSPDLIVWPETASPTLLRRDPALLDALRALSAEHRVPLLIGSMDLVEGSDLRTPVFTNTAFLVTERGITERYDKMHLVPFGEFVPLAGVLGFVRSWAQFITEMKPGTRAVVFPGPPAPFGVVICYEGIFPDLARRFVRAGARLMVNMTNDAWFGRTGGPLQHLAMYPFRAVEHRIAIVRAANTGVSAIIAPSGRIVRTLGLFERANLVGRVPLRDRDTLYSRLGDWLSYVGLLVSALALATALWRPLP